MDSLILLSKLILAAIFGIAGITKLIDLEGSRAAVRDFGVPESLVKPFAILLPVAEVVIALLFFSVASAWVGAVTALLLLVWFTIGMGYQMAQGRAPECHCFGQLYNEPVRVSSLVRNGLFSIPAIFLVLRGMHGQGPSFADLRTYTPEFVFGTLILSGVVAALLYLRQISIRQAELLRRIDVIEAIAGTEGAVERNEAGDPEDGLPIGAVFPDLELPDARGRLVTFSHLLAEGKPVLFFFVAPTCQPCQALMPDISEWQTELSDRLNFVFISRGTVEENAAKFSGGPAKRILFQKQEEFQSIVYAKWTPSALLVNADGRVASHVSTGDVAIRGLIERIREGNIEDPFFYSASAKNRGRAPKIGETVPDFEVKTLDGRTIGSQELRGKPTLVTFWGPKCPHCKEMIKQIKSWEANGGTNEANLLVFSAGDADEHRSYGLSAPIVLDDEYSTAVKFGMIGTPSAVLIDENGRFVSETAIGASNIWALIGKQT